MNSESKKIDLSETVIAALQRGNKIEAIKLVREQQGLDLKGAKDLVEEYLRSQPSLQATFGASQAEASRSAMFWLILMVGAAILGYLFLTRH